MVVMALSACAGLSQSEQATSISVADVISRPLDFDGRIVTIKGWASLRHEDYGIWATEDDYKKRNWKRCISLLNHYPDEAKNKELDRRSVLITGVFNNDILHNESGVDIVRLGTCSKFGIRFVEPDGLRETQI
jgi:hypothetical protein